jgi:hypothetical protein
MLHWRIYTPYVSLKDIYTTYAGAVGMLLDKWMVSSTMDTFFYYQTTLQRENCALRGFLILQNLVVSYIISFSWEGFLHFHAVFDNVAFYKIGN